METRAVLEKGGYVLPLYLHSTCQRGRALLKRAPKNYTRRRPGSNDQGNYKTKHEGGMRHRDHTKRDGGESGYVEINGERRYIKE